ncbi:hypothetical protein F2Q69_00058727 [Brassica cretica]|uniref:Uncharacterized protein n=1 Tax=Brassica cretica TaxID=69181 RepID=A0A8S9RPP1_BRACR|nr:hypothetical protein F2Q69_00058727 [Brassica cretica]
MVLIYHSFKDLDLDIQVFQIWKTSGPEDFQTTSRKSSRRPPGSLPDDFQTTSKKSSDRVFNQMVLIFHLDMYFVCSIKIWIRKSFNYNALGDFQEVFRTTYKKSSRRLPGSLPESGSLPEAGSLIPCQVESKLVFVEK